MLVGRAALRGCYPARFKTGSAFSSCAVVEDVRRSIAATGTFARSAVNTCGSGIGFAPQICKRQDVFSIDLVVQLMESVGGLFLRFGVESTLQLPNLFWSCQTHRQSPDSGALYLHLELRSLPSTEITRLHRYYRPVRHPSRPESVPRGLSVEVPSPLGLPVLRSISSYIHAIATTPADHPDVSLVKSR